MPTYYLNPVVIVLSDLVFKKVDLEPGSGQFVNSDFLIQDFGSMSNLSISVDRTVVDGRIIYYTDANNVVLHSDGAKFFSSDSIVSPYPLFISIAPVPIFITSFKQINAFSKSSFSSAFCNL